MTEVEESAAPIGIDWSLRVANVCQGALGHMLHDDPMSVELVVQHLARELPEARNSTEALLLARSLWPVIDYVGRGVHDRFHQRFAVPPCGLSPHHTRYEEWLLPAHPIAELLQEWLGAYTLWFNHYHGVPLPLRAMRLLERQFAREWTLPALALEVGASRSTLLREFTRAFGVSPKRFLAKERLRAGLMLLRESSCSVDEIARQVGYERGGKFSALVSRYAFLHPTMVRRLTDARFAQVLDAAESRVAGRPERRRLAGQAQITDAADRRQGERRLVERRRPAPDQRAAPRRH